MDPKLEQVQNDGEESSNLSSRKNLSRRKFLQIIEQGAGVLAGISLLGPTAIFGANSKEENKYSEVEYPFKLGVASGDPLPDGFVIWTRLAPFPLSGDGGMPNKPVHVFWEISKDSSFKIITQKGKYTAVPLLSHSVHVELEGLEAQTEYFYRFQTGNHISQVGRTKSAPIEKYNLEKLTFAFLSCQAYDAGYYTAYDHLIKEDLDVVFFLGDYIYENKGGESIPDRIHFPFKTIETLEEYRMRYGQYKSDPSLQAAHATFPWIVIPDDHEIVNDWGGEDKSDEIFSERRTVAYQAFYENMPLRKSSIPNGIQMQLYRKFSFGTLVEFNFLDTRQYRSAPVGKVNEEERFSPERTILGEEQENWLFENLKNSSADWNVIAQQMIIGQKDDLEGLETKYGLDRWDGFVGTRDRLFGLIKRENIPNLIVLTGDSHQNWIIDLKEDFNDPESSVIATEIGGTSISSGGNGQELHKGSRIALAENPHIKFTNAQRGYVRCTLTRDSLKTDFRIVPNIEKRGDSIKTLATYVVKNGVPGAKEIL